MRVHAVSARLETGCFLPAYSAPRRLSRGHVVVWNESASRCDILTLREWFVLRAIGDAADAETVARCSTMAAREAFGATEALARCETLPPWCVSVLLALSPWARAHRRELTPVTTGEAAECIERFAARLLIVPVRARARDDRRIRRMTICVMTCDRPGALARHLTELTHDAGELAEGVATIRVCDASGRSCAVSNQRVCAEYRNKGYPIEYFGSEARDQLIGALTAAGIDGQAARLALAGDRAGAWHNAALLSSPGGPLLFLPDHAVPRVWRAADATSAVRVIDEPDHRHWTFAATTEAAFLGLAPTTDALWRSHAGLVGQRISDVLKAHPFEPYVTTGVHRPSWGALVSETGRIRVTANGHAGQLGPQSLRTLLGLDQTTLRPLMIERQLYERARAGAVGTRSARCIDLSTGGTCAPDVMAVDASDVLPPFAPQDDSAADMFLNLLGRIDRHATIAHLPDIVELERRESTIGGVDAIWFDTSLPMTDLMNAIVEEEDSYAAVVRSPQAHLGQLGHLLAMLRRASERDLRERIQSAWRAHASRLLTATDRVLSSTDEGSSWWTDDVRRLRRQVLTDLTSAEAPLQGRCTFPHQSGLECARAWLSDVGTLAESWPEMWTVAASLRRQD